MPKMCLLPVKNSPPIYVNPALVRSLRDGGSYTSIQFDKDNIINVELPMEQVRAMLDKAMNEG